MKSNHSFIRILLLALFVLVLLCLCFAQNKNRIKRVRRFEESEIYHDVIRAEDDEFVDDIPIEEEDWKDIDQDVEYENCIEYQGGHKEIYTPNHRGDKSTHDSDSSDDSQAQQELSFNPYSYFKSLLDQDVNYAKYYGDKVKNHGSDSQYAQIAKKYANNLANHAKYLYKYKTFAPATYRKYILQVYEYSKRVVEVAKVQNWNGYMYYLSITIEYYRKIEVLEQTGYAGTNYVQTTPVATYYGASGTPSAYYSNGAPPPPAGAVTATAVGPANPSYYPASYGGYGYPAAAPVANYYPYTGGYGGYSGYPSSASYYPANYNYPNPGYPSSYYPAQYRPVQTIAKAADVNSQQPVQGSSSSQASTNSTDASAGSSASTPSSSASSSSQANNTNGSSTTSSNASASTNAKKRSLNPIEQLEELNSHVSSHVGEFNDDASNPKTEPFTFEYLM